MTKGNISINLIIYIILGMVILAALSFAVKEAISNVDNVECAGGNIFCNDYEGITENNNDLPDQQDIGDDK